MQLGRSGEYLVLHDLLLQGIEAYPTEQGMPYDLVIDFENILHKVQVKATSKPITTAKSNNPFYRFSIRSGNANNNRKVACASIDILALVALDIKAIAYLGKQEFGDDTFIITQEFRSYKTPYVGRIYANGTERKRSQAKYFEDYGNIYRIINGEK